MTPLPIIKESKNQIWKYAFCPECGKQLTLKDAVFSCTNDDYCVDKMLVDWNDVSD